MNSDWHWDKVTGDCACTSTHTSQVSSDGHILWSWQQRQCKHIPYRGNEHRTGLCLWLPPSLLETFSSSQLTSIRRGLSCYFFCSSLWGFLCSIDGLELYIAGELCSVCASAESHTTKYWTNCNVSVIKRISYRGINKISISSATTTVTFTTVPTFTNF